MNLLILALAPVVIILVYVYIRDKYEREPIGFLLKALLVGMLIVIPVIFVEDFLSGFSNLFPGLLHAAYDGFVVAAFTEELFKFIAFMWLIWNNKNFNEKFDGIVYAVFISLGFAAVENVMYVFSNGAGVAYLRAFTAVPAHALFAVAMGYHLALAKFDVGEKSQHLFKAMLYAVLLHGFYDFILMSQNTYLLLLFIPFIIYMWYIGFKRMKLHSDISKFRFREGNLEDDI